MAARPITWLDVFTSTPLAGNGLAVVHDADGLDDETMLRFARETKLSETTFVQSPTEDGADYRNRIWMMTGELPFAGHPSLGTAVAVARERGETQAAYVQQTPAGLQRVEVEIDGDRAQAWMTQERPDFRAELDPAEVLATVGLPASVADPELPPQVISTGVPHLMACVRSVEGIAPDYDAIAALLAPHEAVVLYLAVVDGDRAHVRGFVNSAEVGEDPATGSAAGPLVAHVHARLGTKSLTIAQGVEMGRPSVLEARVEGEDIRVGGEAVVLFDGQIRLDR